MKPYLVISNGEPSRRQIPLEGNKKYIVGRDQTADITLPEKKISRRHASIKWDAHQNTIWFEDLHSLNGSFVNGEVVTHPVSLKDGDEIHIGSFYMILHGFNMDAEIIELNESDERNPDHTDSTHLKQIDDSTGGRLITGKLKDLSLPDLLQMLATTKKSGLLVISKFKQMAPPTDYQSDQFGVILMNEGLVTHCRYGSHLDDEAFRELLSFETGYFVLYPPPKVPTPETMSMPVEMLLLDSLRRLDESKANRVRLNSRDTLTVNLDKALTQLGAEELQVFQLVWKHKRVEDILKHSPYTQDETQNLFQKLLQKDFIHKKP